MCKCMCYRDRERGRREAVRRRALLEMSKLGLPLCKSTDEKGNMCFCPTNRQSIYHEKVSIVSAHACVCACTVTHTACVLVCSTVRVCCKCAGPPVGCRNHAGQTGGTHTSKHRVIHVEKESDSGDTQLVEETHTPTHNDAHVLIFKKLFTDCFPDSFGPRHNRCLGPLSFDLSFLIKPTDVLLLSLHPRSSYRQPQPHKHLFPVPSSVLVKRVSAHFHLHAATLSVAPCQLELFSLVHLGVSAFNAYS